MTYASSILFILITLKFFWRMDAFIRTILRSFYRHKDEIYQENHVGISFSYRASNRRRLALFIAPAFRCQYERGAFKSDASAIELSKRRIHQPRTYACSGRRQYFYRYMAKFFLQ